MIDTTVFSDFAIFEGRGSGDVKEAAYTGARSLSRFITAQEGGIPDCAGFMNKSVRHINSVITETVEDDVYSSFASVVFKNGGLYAISTGTSKIYIQRGTDIKELFGQTVGYLGQLTDSQMPQVISGRIEVGDRILICNGKLAHRLHSDVINRIMDEEEYADDCADRLVKEARAKGCDTATAMVFDVVEAEGTEEPWLRDFSFAPVPKRNTAPDGSVDYPIKVKEEKLDKKVFAIVIACALAAVILITCIVITFVKRGKKDDDAGPTAVPDAVTTETEEAVIDAEHTTGIFNTEQTTIIKPSETKPGETTTETTTAVTGDVPETTKKEEDQTSPDGRIVVKDGITYVSGVLIANKTYSLPADYNPGGLTKETQDAFNDLKAAAAKEGLSFWNQSGFRSYETQKGLYNRYVAADGKAAADRYSARPGHSEHQTGLALDVNIIDQSFANTAEGKWLAANCYKYGFIIRYPKDKEDVTGYMYEPWHIRYLGVDLATKVYESGLCLEEYLDITSEYQDD